MTLEVPQPAPARAELRVTVGALPAGSRIVVRLESGVIVGAVAPFGPDAAAKGGVYLIPLDASAIRDGKLVVRLQLEEGDGKQVRAPTQAELPKIELVSSP